MKPVFGHGRLRLYLLKLLDENPRHGYEVIRLLEDRFLGLYAPSAGTVYPRLARLESEGLVTHYQADGRKVYRITEAGRAELNDRQQELSDLEAEIRSSVHDLAREIREEVKGSVRNLREELKHAAREVRRQERHASRQERQERDGEDHERPHNGHPNGHPDAPHDHDVHDHARWTASPTGRELERLIDRFREEARAAIRRGTVTDAQVQTCRSLLNDTLDVLRRAIEGPDRKR
jgi:DNA-binding PadR family transcriptional regulator